ncbi:MAG: murein L,D-transpeptidase family protein [Bauldia sp.]
MAARRILRTLVAPAALVVAAAILAGCQGSEIPKQLKPVPHTLVTAMDQLDMKATSRIFIRIFKEESALEVWKERRDGTFALLKTYDICKWSGDLGPKKQEGDRQAPEGFYTVTPAQMNPKSSYYLSFNIGYPNAYDRSLGRTGANLMVHGACSSAGCYSMSDEDAGEIFALARDSFRGGQTSFQIQAFPFRMTPDNLARHRDSPNLDFWRMLKVGSDHFELTKRPPKIDVCERRYVFDVDAGTARFEATSACPPYQVPEALVLALAEKEVADERAFADVVASLEKKETLVAEAASVAAAKAAEKEKRAEEGGSALSFVTRWFRGDDKPAEGATTVGAIPPPATPAKTPAATSVASIPVPMVAPTASAGPTPAGAPAQPPAAEPAAASAPAITPAMTPQSPPPGKFVKGKFWWMDDEPVDAAADAPG